MAKSVQDVVKLIYEIEKTTKDTYSFFDRISDLLAEICSESLDSSKVIGWVSYDGSPKLDNWEYKDGCYPFHITDTVTGKKTPDPRVIIIGKVLDGLGEEWYGDGFVAMHEVYIRTAQRIHTRISALESAWHGIGKWQM